MGGGGGKAEGEGEREEDAEADAEGEGEGVEVSWLSGSDRGLASSRSPVRTQVAAVVPLGKALYPRCLVFRRRKPSVPCIGESHPVHVKEPT